jgi:hypothetical protein
MNRELRQAQADLNEAVAEWARLRERCDTLAQRWREFDQLRRDFDGRRPAVARDTSITAAMKQPSAAGSLRRQVVQAVVSNWSLHRTGMTTDELEARFRRTHQSVSSAVNDMESKGWLRDGKTRRATRSKSPAIVWEPTEIAIEWIHRVNMEGAA